MDILKAFVRRVRPQTEQVAVAPIYSKYSSYPSHGLTPQKLAAIFREADDGEVLRQMELYEEMEEHDPHLCAQLQTRKNAVTGLDWEVVSYSDDAADEQIASFINQQLHGIKNLEDIMLDLLDAIGKGLAVSEIMWKIDGDHVRVDRIQQVQPTLLRWDMDDMLRIVTQDAPIGIEPPPNKFIFHYYKAKSGHPSRAGVLRVCAWMYLFKNYDVKDWVAFAEVFGLPLRLGKYAAGASEDDKDALWKALVQMGTDAAGMVAEGTSIEFITTDGSKGSASGIFETLARYCDEQISKAILGQTLTADSGSGSYAQSKTHNDVRHDLTVADCKALAATLRDDLIRPLVLFNFGPAYAERLPSIVFDCELPEDLQALSTILSTLSGIGVPIPLSYVYRKFSIPEPEKDEAVARQPTSVSYPLSLRQVAASAPVREDWQDRIDRLSGTLTGQSVPVWEELLAPIRALADNCKTLEELKNELETQAGDLLDATPDTLASLLADGMLVADLAGRLKAHG